MVGGVGGGALNACCWAETWTLDNQQTREEMCRKEWDGAGENN